MTSNVIRTCKYNVNICQRWQRGHRCDAHLCSLRCQHCLEVLRCESQRVSCSLLERVPNWLQHVTATSAKFWQIYIDHHRSGFEQRLVTLTSTSASNPSILRAISNGAGEIDPQCGWRLDMGTLGTWWEFQNGRRISLANNLGHNMKQSLEINLGHDWFLLFVRLKILLACLHGFTSYCQLETRWFSNCTANLGPYLPASAAMGSSPSIAYKSLSIAVSVATFLRQWFEAVEHFRKLDVSLIPVVRLSLARDYLSYQSR